MVLKFDFFYSSDNDFFEYLLHFYAQDFFYYLEKNEGQINFYLKGDESELTRFCETLNDFPSSVFLRHFDVSAADINEIQKSSFEPENYQKRDFLTRLNSKAFLEKSAFVFNEWGEFSEDEISFKNENDFTKINPENALNLINIALLSLEKNESLYLKNHLGIYEFSLLKESFENDFLMPCDIKTISSAFVCNNEQLKLLASLEKPLLSLRMSSIFRQNHGLKIKENRLKLANNIFLFALTQALFKRGHNFLRFLKIKSFEPDFEVFECEKSLVILRGFDFINQKAKELIFSKGRAAGSKFENNLQNSGASFENASIKNENLKNERVENESLNATNLNEARNFARISYILSRFKKDVLILELSQNYEDILLINKELNLLQISLPSSADALYSEIRKDEVGAKLLQNFALNFKLLEGEFRLKNNFYSLFALVGRILNLDNDLQKAAQRLFELSDESKMPRGVKIDYRFKEPNDKGFKEFDYTRTLRSVMSFLLAGVDVNNIAYGAVESLAFFLRDVFDDLYQKKQAQSAVITGSLFAHKSLLKNTLKHIKHCELSDVPLYL